MSRRSDSMLDALLEAWDLGCEAPPLERAALLVACGGGTEGRDPNALTIGEQNAALLALRRALLGGRLEAITACPGCAAGVEIELEVDTLLGEASPNGARNLVEVDGQRATVRPPTARDVADALASGDPAATLLARCIDTGDGATVTAAIVAAAEQRIATLDPLADPELAIRCPECGSDAVLPFDIPAYVWREIDEYVRSLLSDVHRLAAAYGWTEPEILALPPRRRRFYLDRVSA
jgi:hypothetical protein